MKKKSLLALMLVLVVCMALVMVLASCGNDSSNPNSPDNDGNIKPNENDQGGDVEEHTHVWSEWELVTVPTETSVGSIKRSCECGAEEIVELPFVNDTNYTIERIEPTCTEKGKMICTVKNNFLDYTIEVELEALGHDFGDPIYEWNEDKTVCTATRICNRDTKHVEVATATVTTVVVEPTCDTLGSTTYTATFSEDWAEEQSDIVYVDVLGHDYGVTTYDWSDDKTTCTAQRICNRDPNHIDIATATVNINRVEPTCYTLGTITYTAIFNETWADMQTYTEEIPALGHDFGAPTYHWNEYHTVCQAQRVCTRDPHHVEISTATVNIETIDATCTEQGSIICTATFVDPWAETQTEITKTEALGHDFMAPTYEWSVDNSTYTATRVCNRNPNHIETAHATVTSTRVEPTCTQKGSIEYVATFTESWATGQTKYVELEMKPHTYESVVTAPTCTDEGYTTHICSVCGHSYVDTYVDALGHDYGEATYTWSEDNTTCTATRVCNRDKNHQEVLSATIVVDELAPTCLVSGTKKYTATFNKKWAETQNKTVTVPALGHDWQVKYDFSTDGKTCTATRECLRDSSHNLTETVNTTSEVIQQPTCTEMGKTTYTATFTSTWASSQSTTLSDVDMLEHSYVNGETVAPTCTEDGYTLRKCSVCGHEDKFDIVKATGHNVAPNSNYCLTCNEVVDYNCFEFELKDATYRIKKYTGNYVDLKVPATYKGINVTRIGLEAFRNNTNLSIVDLPDTIISIDNYAFDGCSALTSINLPNSIQSILWHAFSRCSSLQSITLPSNIIEISNDVFSYCTALTSVNIPDGVISIGDYAFNGCSALTSVNIPEGVTSIGDYAFNECSSLTSITLPDSLTSLGLLAFGNCTLLESINLPNGITQLKNLTFENCNALNNVILPDGLTTLGSYVFSKCTSLTSISIPNSVTSVGDGVFSSCTALASVNIPNKLTMIPERFLSDCGLITSITIPSDVTSIGAFAFSRCKGLTSITIPNKVSEIGACAFDGCTGFTSIDIPNSVTIIKDSAFSSCTALESINIPDSVTSIQGSAFSYCSAFTSIVLPAGIPSIESHTFYGCTSLENITIPESVTSIGDMAFYQCGKLLSISIPSNVTSIGMEAFYRCGVESITFEDNSQLTSIGDNAFYLCELKSITIPANVTSIGSGILSYCGQLESIVVDTANTKYTSRDADGNEKNCIIDKEINSLVAGCMNTVIPEGVKSIGDAAFQGSVALSKIVIPSSVITIGDNAFKACYSIKIYAKAKNYPLGWVDSWSQDDGQIYWFSETKPDAAPTNGNGYWYYDADGVTPKIWQI